MLPLASQLLFESSTTTPVVIPVFNNYIPNAITPKTAATMQSNNDSSSFFPSSSSNLQTNLQYYLTPSPKYMATTAMSNSSAQGMMMIPEKHRLLHKSSKSLGIQQTITKKSEQQILNSSSNSNTINSVNDKATTTPTPLLNQHVPRSHQQSYNRMQNTGCVNNTQYAVESFERSKSSSNMLAVSSQNPRSSLQGCQFISQEKNILPIVSSQISNPVSSFLPTAPFQDKENQQVSSQGLKPRDTCPSSYSTSRLPLTPIQRIQEKHKPTKKSQSPAGCTGLIDSQCILQSSSKAHEGMFQQNSSISRNRMNHLLSNNPNASSQMIQSSNWIQSQLPSSINKLTIDQLHLTNKNNNNSSLEDASSSINNSKKSLVQYNPFFKQPIADCINNNNNNSSATTSSMFLHNNNHRNNHIQEKSTKMLHQKIISPRVSSCNPRASTAVITDDACTAIGTLPSMQYLQSPRRQTLSLWAERCNTTESEYQQYQKGFWEAKTEESMIEGGGCDNRIILGASRSISCSDSVMKNTHHQQQQLMNQNRNSNSQMNCIRIEHAIDSNEDGDDDTEQQQQLLTEVSSIKQRNRQLVMQEAQDRKQQQDAYQEIDKLKREIEQLRLINNQKKQENDHTTTITTLAMQDQINCLTTNNHILEQKIKQIEEENSALKESKLSLLLDRDMHLHQLSACNERIHSLEQINSQSQQEEINACNRWNKEQGMFESQAASMRAEITTQKVHINDLSQLLAESQLKSNEMNNRIKELQEQIKILEIKGQEYQGKVIEQQSVMIGMSEKAKEAAEKAQEASTKLVVVTEDANKLKEEIQELEKDKGQLKHYQIEFDGICQAIRLILSEFAERILACSEKKQTEDCKEDLEKYVSSDELVNKLKLFSEGLRRLLDEGERRKEQLAQKDRIINQHENVAKELEKEIQELQQGKYSSSEEGINRNNNNKINSDCQNIEEQMGIIQSKFNSVIVEGSSSYQSSNQYAIEGVKKEEDDDDDDEQEDIEYLQQPQDNQKQQQQQQDELLCIPRKIQEYIEKEQRLFEQTFRERMADVEKEMFKQMHEKDQMIQTLNQEKMRISELNESRLVEQKILQAHLDRKQEESVRSAKAIEELQKRLRNCSSVQPGAGEKNQQQDGMGKNQIKEQQQQQQITGMVALRDRRLAIDSIREEEENEESLDEDAFETLNTYNSFEQQELQQQKQPLQDEQSTELTSEYQSSQQENLKELQQSNGLEKQYYQEAMEWKTKVDEKRKMISKLRRELDKSKGRLLDMEERQFNLESLNRRMAAELETVKASSQDVPKLIDMLKARKLEYLELKRRFDSMKQERDSVVKAMKGSKVGSLNQSIIDIEYQKNNHQMQHQSQQSQVQHLVRKETNDQEKKTQQELSSSSERQRNGKETTVESKSQVNQLAEAKQINQRQQLLKQQSQQQQQLRSHSLSVERTQILNTQ